MQFQNINNESTKHCDLINKRFEFGRGGGGGVNYVGSSL